MPSLTLRLRQRSRPRHHREEEKKKPLNEPGSEEEPGKGERVDDKVKGSIGQGRANAGTSSLCGLARSGPGAVLHVPEHPGSLLARDREGRHGKAGTPTGMGMYLAPG